MLLLLDKKRNIQALVKELAAKMGVKIVKIETVRKRIMMKRKIDLICCMV